MTRIISIPAINRRVSMSAYVAAIKLAKANPDTMFNHGLDCWWPCTGEEIMLQFREAVHHRINEVIPYQRRGICLTTKAEVAA